MTDAHRIAEITLDERTVIRRNPEIERERAAAIADLVHANRFTPASGLAGPFRVHLATAEGRLTLEIAPVSAAASETIVLPLRPFARIIKDYFLVCESYSKALRSANLGQVEAIDMGRRGLHDEGAGLLVDSLTGKVEIDRDTARRLFTLICVLHLKPSSHGLGTHARS
ncbi:MAG TPA: UPF0262 family protein [Stellaceae bacterium]|jgi:uncharacterized protein (UPF0262 family)|nr:UPF0262 family protein [Stellaceae bacterium]